MNIPNKIIGHVGASILKDHISVSLDQVGLSDSPALFRLDRLKEEHIVAIINQIRSDPELKEHIYIQIPNVLIKKSKLPAEVLSTENAGAIRNTTTAKTAILTANGMEPNLEDTLEHVTSLGVSEFRTEPVKWAEATIATTNMSLTPPDHSVLTAALEGLLATEEIQLYDLSEFCALIGERSHQYGEPIRHCIGWALPALLLPRDSALFANTRTYTRSVAKWTKIFTKLFSERALLVLKQLKNGQSLDSSELEKRLERSRKIINPNAIPIIEEFINISSNHAIAKQLCSYEWEVDGIYLLFDLPKPRKQSLAQETLDFFSDDCSDPDILTSEWKTYLDELKTREKTNEWDDDDKEFFECHGPYLDQNPKLKSRWEIALFGQPIECTDFLQGLVTAIQRLTAIASGYIGERQVTIKALRTRKDWREKLNHDVGRYFSMMYRGLETLLQEHIKWDKTISQNTDLPDPLFNYPKFLDYEKSRLLKRNGKSLKSVTSIAKQQMQLKFEINLEVVDKKHIIFNKKIHLVWFAQPQAIGMDLCDDIKRLQLKGIAYTNVTRRLVSNRGYVQPISLLETNTLEATFGQNCGSLVPAKSKIGNLGHDITQRINQLIKDGRLTAEHAHAIDDAWKQFQQTYRESLVDFLDRGLHCDSILKQADAFGNLLRLLKQFVRGDIARSRLVAKILQAGTVEVTGGRPSIIIPPWHPERMKALCIKLHRSAGLINYLLSFDKIEFGDRNIFFQEFNDELVHPFYPEIAIADQNGAFVLVTETSTVNGYSLLEEPVQSSDTELNDVNSTEAAKQIRELIERYVGLQKHEASSLSIVLYNADAASLPLDSVHELAKYKEALPSLQCNVAVRHSDDLKLRKLYAELVNKSDAGVDVPIISNISNNFMSKLRISVIPSNASISKVKNNFRPFDIAFLHDVVARTAAVEWIPTDSFNDRNSFEHAPSRWSYRNVSGEDELKSTIFLTCPQQTASGRAFLDMIGAVVRQVDAPSSNFLVPARQISLQNQKLSQLFQDAHDIAEWVATYDELLDKRQLLANEIKIVRYRRHSTNGRNMIVSSTSELRLLKVLTKRRLSELGLSVSKETLDTVSDRIIRDALSISGDIVLRAAKRGISAGEMLGLVFSRYLIHKELIKQCAISSELPLQIYFLLDDYASWLAQRENRIADILGLCIEDNPGELCLHIIVVESKFVSENSLADAKRSSKTQLSATLSTLRDALFGDPGRLDRDLWLTRLSDLLIDAEIQPNQSSLLERARFAIRDGSIKLTLRGYSHIFVHTPNVKYSYYSSSEFSTIEVLSPALATQEVFNRNELRRIANAYIETQDPTNIREEIIGKAFWTNLSVVPLAPRIVWTDMIEKLSLKLETKTEADVSNLDLIQIVDGVIPTIACFASDTSDNSMIGSKEISSFDVINRDSSDYVYGEALCALINSHVSASSTNEDDRELWVEDVANTLKKALNSYGMQANIIGTRLTPNGCLVRLAGSDRLRIEDIESKRTQLLTTHSLQLITVQPKPGEIIVSLASLKRQSVSLLDIWARRKIKRNTAGLNTSFILGFQEINGNVLYLNLGSDFGGLSQHEPHSLIAGATGSGKSVLIQSLLLDIAASNTCKLAKIILIDPKMGVDYVALESLPHFQEPIITTQERSTTVLNTLVEEMERRYRIFAQARARDLSTFNSKVSAAERLPMIFLVHDEFADWMLDDNYKSIVSTAVARLGVKARAAGIHLFFAAQRPDKDVMPMQLRENLGNRLILKVASEATSRIVLDRSGGERLLGKGHLAAKLNGELGLLFGQAPFLNDEELEAVVDAIKRDQMH